MRSISRKIRGSLVVPAIIALTAMSTAPAIAQTAPTDKDAIEKIVRDYILKNPEITAGAIQRL